MINLTHLLPRLLQANPELAVKLAWSSAAGAGLRREAIPSRLDERRLVISVADAIWQKQLQAMSAELIYRLNKLLGQRVVNELVFRIDPAEVANARAGEKLSSPKGEPAPAPTELLFAAAAINDQDLRDRFIRAAKNCIARRDSHHEND